MSGVSTLELRRAMLLQFFRGEDPPWTYVQVALTRKVPATNAADGQLDEPIGGGYDRADYGFDYTRWTLNNDNEITNNTNIVWPVCTVAWGVMHGWAILGPTSGGSLVLAVGTLVEPYRVVPGIQPIAAANSLTFGLYDNV